MKSQNRIRTERNTRNHKKAQAACATAPQPPAHDYQEEIECLLTDRDGMERDCPPRALPGIVVLPVPGLTGKEEWPIEDAIMEIARWVHFHRDAILKGVFADLDDLTKPAILGLLMASDSVCGAYSHACLHKTPFEEVDLDLPFIEGSIGRQPLGEIIVQMSWPLYDARHLISARFIQNNDSPMEAYGWAQALCLAEAVLYRVDWECDLDDTGNSPLRAWLQKLAPRAVIDHMINPAKRI